MAWTLEGTYFENCSCDTICPCSAVTAGTGTFSQDVHYTITVTPPRP